MLKLVECPRDAMQGWHHAISTADKIAYINSLLRVGFDTIDFGSFVSPKAIPQMADTVDVLKGLEIPAGGSKLLAIVANLRGALSAVEFEEISYLGFPFSISETFQLRNTNKTIAASLEEVAAIQELCLKNRKQLVVYISMGFGNPYGDPYDAAIAMKWVDELVKLDIQVISLADTVGVAQPKDIHYLFSHLIPAYKNVEFGAHFHSTPSAWYEKIDAAYAEGCRRFDSTIKGFGGCPMAKDELVGNIATENLLFYSKEKQVPLLIDEQAFSASALLAAQIFV
ncbi:hydroxymethylglutaryl-CoA lyase [Chitinophaga skermanii]|uniref:Hydroxymethylglutaryl-CoA lyase n=1 Tax=Chitinophaga skermanii TaxID=331697 RepID=A0A327QWC3_9BACT|nr:hydroxymethylglutaryl-CoA lyase [Chitinophaga skermanii]RAJ08899.1 hydroxymethylglutaryl-CoA lyase [Chitinophaga skermanii]